MPELDAVRGVAILMVVFCHGFYAVAAWPEPSKLANLIVKGTAIGSFGVNLFFVLSGFLITGILLEAKTDIHYYRRFYTRRALRILPIFYVALFILAWMPSQNKNYLLVSFFYLSNMAPLLGIPMTYNLLWSLAVEEHFYFVWPLVVRTLSRRAIVICAVAIVVLVPVLRGITFVSDAPLDTRFYTWLVADGLAIGAVLAVYVRQAGRTRNDVLRFSLWAMGVGAALFVATLPFGLLSHRRLAGGIFMLTTVHFLFVGVLGLVLLAGSGRWSFLVNRPVLQFFGKISYGLYLIHWMVFLWYDALMDRFFPALRPLQGKYDMVVLRFVCSAAAATVLSVLSRRYLEEPFLRMKKHLPWAHDEPRIAEGQRALANG